MYTAVLERTREIGILKALGASPGYMLGHPDARGDLAGVIGTIAGILMTYGTTWLMHTFAPPLLSQAIVYDWWPWAAADFPDGRGAGRHLSGPEGRPPGRHRSSVL